MKKIGRTIDQPVSGIDFYPTFRELSGLNADPLHIIDGTSLIATLRDNKKLNRNLFLHYPYYSNQGGVPASVMLEGRYKLIEFFGNTGSKYELYNLDTDFSETINLLKNEPSKAASMANHLRD